MKTHTQTYSHDFCDASQTYIHLIYLRTRFMVANEHNIPIRHYIFISLSSRVLIIHNIYLYEVHIRTYAYITNIMNEETIVVAALKFVSGRKCQIVRVSRTLCSTTTTTSNECSDSDIIIYEYILV